MSNKYYANKAIYEIPNFIKKSEVQSEKEKSKNGLSKWILLAGPSYENCQTYTCSILIETKKLFIWSITSGKTINLRNKIQSETVRNFSSRVIKANDNLEAVSILEEPLREVLQFYLPKFLKQKCLTIFCSYCKKLDVEIKNYGNANDENYKWQCECGNILKLSN